MKKTIGFIACEPNGDLYLYSEKPSKCNDDWFAFGHCEYLGTNESTNIDISFESEPIECFIEV
mgnify:CR=1 FL=1